MAVRAKMQVTGITERVWGGKEIELTPQYDQSIPEDQRFQKATPSGRITMQIDNPAAAEQLRLGRTFYVDFTPVAEATPAGVGG
jgi:hypothetical protein